MNFQSLIYSTAAERLQVDAVLALDEIQRIEETICLAESCCDLYNQTFVGEIGEA